MRILAAPSPRTQLPKTTRPAPEPARVSPPGDQVKLTSDPARPFLATSTLLRTAKWTAIGAAAGVLPFILGAKAGMYASMFASTGLVNALADGRKDWTQWGLAVGAGAALSLALSVGGAYIGGFEPGFATSTMIQGGAALGAYTGLISLAGDAVRWKRDLPLAGGGLAAESL